MNTLNWSRRPFRGQGRIADTFGKVAEWVTAGRGISHPYPGVELETKLADRIQRQMWAGTYEMHVRTCFETLIDEGHTVLDVGAHIGFHAAAAAFLCGSSGRVAAFEADPELHRHLRRNLAQFPWAHAIYGAVWKFSGDVCFERAAERQESGWGTVVDVRDQGKGEIVRVPSIAIDDWANKSGVRRVDFVKVDAEGSEPAVLSGAGKTIAEHRPVMILELNDELLEEGRSSSREIVDLARNFDYEVYHLAWLRLERWDGVKHHGLCEVLCVPPDRNREVIRRLEGAGFTLAN
jgi:FkbM family methyltransferase